MKILKFEGKYKNNFFFSENICQNIFGKLNILCKIGQNQKILLAVFVKALTVSVKWTFMGATLGTMLCPPDFGDPCNISKFTNSHSPHASC